MEGYDEVGHTITPSAQKFENILAERADIVLIIYLNRIQWLAFRCSLGSMVSKDIHRGQINFK